MVDKITYQIISSSIDLLESDFVTAWFCFLEYTISHGLLSDKPLANYLLLLLLISKMKV